MSDQAGYGARPPEDPYEGRRQFYELTPAELRATPAWWFPGSDGHLSGPDDGTVMPVETEQRRGPVEFPDGKYLLHALFTLADGTSLDGHVTFAPDDASTLSEREPTLCLATAQITLWHGVLAPDETDLARTLAVLERTREQVFPLRWETRLHPPDGPLLGRLDGFAIWRDGAVAYI